MAFPESSEWTLEGEEASEFLNRLFEEKEKRPLITPTRLSSEELHRKVVENARRRKNEE